MAMRLNVLGNQEKKTAQLLKSPWPAGFLRSNDVCCERLHSPPLKHRPACWVLRLMLFGQKTKLFKRTRRPSVGIALEWEACLFFIIKLKRTLCPTNRLIHSTPHHVDVTTTTWLPKLGRRLHMPRLSEDEEDSESDFEDESGEEEGDQHSEATSTTTSCNESPLASFGGSTTNRHFVNE